MVRHKNRYIIIEVTESPGDTRKPTNALKLNQNLLYRSIINMVQKLHGDFGVAACTAGFVLRYCNEKTRVAIIRCRHGPHKLVASSLPILKSIGTIDVHLNILYTGATMKHCFNFIQRYQQKKFDEFCVGLKTDEEKEELRREIMQLEPLLKMP
ncbi:ribonuclease P/MRP protein subunit POP5 [Tribolium castaneum]|uniref:Ribonuclease P/MRP protein subunit POP5 n=1 Tax=Tribolium castaneum TaxID=7070 RepID=D6WZ72_TRICA|nr:PREDICTED: ribonuclease P/MRP protein subunit POP5 [Tribolium castaneum]EFA10388.1 Ribonuclease P/MRP protein subunit POP5-like Protein [Tribolium castaneum]|eukprot:XP_974634.1 PREDICTED: ribonuclease P/MRP protein subunit POP5 [Tribolium castaneum]